MNCMVVFIMLISIVSTSEIFEVLIKDLTESDVTRLKHNLIDMYDESTWGNATINIEAIENGFKGKGTKRDDQEYKHYLSKHGLGGTGSVKYQTGTILVGNITTYSWLDACAGPINFLIDFYATICEYAKNLGKTVNGTFRLWTIEKLYQAAASGLSVGGDIAQIATSLGEISGAKYCGGQVLRFKQGETAWDVAISTWRTNDNGYCTWAGTKANLEKGLEQGRTKALGVLSTSFCIRNWDGGNWHGDARWQRGDAQFNIWDIPCS